jgi:hypothetical protein
MSRKGSRIALIVVLLGCICLSCGDSKEREARELLVQSQELLQQRKWVEFNELMNRIIWEYPDTQAATAAEMMLKNMTERANLLTQTALRGAFSVSMGYLASDPTAELDLEKLYDYGYRKVDDVEITIVGNRLDNLLIAGKHIGGDRKYYIDRDGVIKADEEG